MFKVLYSNYRQWAGVTQLRRLNQNWMCNLSRTFHKRYMAFIALYVLSMLVNAHKGTLSSYPRTLRTTYHNATQTKHARDELNTQSKGWEDGPKTSQVAYQKKVRVRPCSLAVDDGLLHQGQRQREEVLLMTTLCPKTTGRFLPSCSSHGRSLLNVCVPVQCASVRCHGLALLEHMQTKSQHTKPIRATKRWTIAFKH